MGGVKPLLYSLALTTTLCTPSFATTTTPEINVDYLNELTGPKVTWETATESDSDIVLINGAYYKYTYHKPDDYTETNTRLEGNMDENDVNKVVFNGIKTSGLDTYHPTGGAIYNTVYKGNIASDFINNTIQKNIYASGGGLKNNLIINNIKGNFISNSSISQNDEAHGGAIYSDEFSIINNLAGNFIGNYAQGFDGASGGAIDNHADTNGASIINTITGTFVGNYAYSINNLVYGGAIANGNSSLGGWEHSGTIKNINNSVFIGNYALSETDRAFGGAIYYSQEGNSQALTITNSSFYNNYAKGKEAQGGAIYNQGLLNIVADNGNSIFSGNYVETIKDDGTTTKKSNAIFNLATTNLTSINNALIQFDDKINMNIRDLYEAYGIQITKDENGNYVLTSPDGSETLTSHKTPFGDFLTLMEQTISSEEAATSIAELEAQGIPFFQKGNDYFISVDGAQVILTQQPDGNYLVETGLSTSGGIGKINITGDQSSQVVFNETVGAAMIDISGTNVFANKGSFARSTTHSGGILNIGADAVLEDSIVDNGGKVNITSSATAERTEVNDGGTLHIASGGTANDTTVNSGGKLETEVSAKLNNLLANGGAILDIDAGSILTGNVIIDANAEMGGTYDYSKIFKDEVLDSGSLTLVGGLNNAMTSDSLINNVADKKLNLTSGDYSVGYGAQTVSGWDSLTISDATVKVEGVIDMAEASKVINVTSNSILDLAGHSPLVTTIIGSVNNDGTLNFHHADDDADDITNIYGNYTAYNNAQMIIDVNPSTKSSDLMIVDGDVAGTTKVTVYRITDGTTTDLIKFVDALNDDTSTGAYFTVHRVYAEALDITDQWKIVHQDNAWHITSVDTPTNSNDGYGTSDTGDLDVDIVTDVTLPNNFPTSPTIKPNTSTNNQTSNKSSKTKLVSEALAYISLPKVGLEQVRDLVRIVSNKVASSKIKSGRCGMAECEYDGQAVNGAWIDLGHKKSEIDAPVAVEAKINAVDLGFDIQKDLHNRLGIFASYRQGEYELSGDGKDYYAKKGANIDIDSWILGLYHRYDKGRLWTMSSIYGGIQKVDMSTDDGVSSDTDGIQFGGSVEAGLVFEPQKRLTIEPSIRLGYNFIKYDDMSDSYGKTAEFDNVQNIEAEAGVKVEKTFFHNNRRVISKIYVKPSIIQNFGKGDVNITSLDTVEGLENETLIRGEIGGSFNFGNGWSGFGSLGYTYGSDYDATDFNIGINYNW